MAVKNNRKNKKASCIQSVIIFIIYNIVIEILLGGI